MEKQQCHCSVKIQNLGVKRGGRIILNNVSLNVNHGEILALIGKNGAGKTTLLKAIINSVDYSGRITFFNSKGQKITNPKIGYVPQSLRFERDTPMTVLDLFCTNSNNMPIWLGRSRQRTKKAYELLSKVGAEEYLHKSIGKLSGGELQRVLLAFAIDPMPDILLLDEPVSAIDRNGISKFYSLLTSMRSEYHMPIIIVSHDLGHVYKYSTSYALVDRTIKEIGKAKDMINSKNVKQTFGFDIDRGDTKWI